MLQLQRLSPFEPATGEVFEYCMWQHPELPVQDDKLAEEAYSLIAGAFLLLACYGVVLVLHSGCKRPTDEKHGVQSGVGVHSWY